MAEGIVGRVVTKLQETTGQTVVPTERLELLEAYYQDYRVLNRQLEDIGWSVLNYVSGQPQEMAPQHRLRVVQQSRYVWMNDPQAGASVELMNDFCFGRGVPRPRAKDELVQTVIDEAWDDPDNQEVLTTIEAQLGLGTDLALQSNVFLLVFGLEADEAGPVKLSILRHDDVVGYVPHPDKRHRTLYYMAKEVEQRWDYETDTLKPLDPSQVAQAKPTYYQQWRNVDLTEEEGDTEEWRAPDDRLGEGRVYHLRINRSTEQVFGIPRFQRTLTWYSAYNKYVKDRLDIVAAAAAVIMKRQVKGTPSQLLRDAQKAISRDSPLALGLDADPNVQGGPRRPAGILEENESAVHTAFNLDTRAGNAQQDAQIIRSPISAAERFPASYYGDATASNLATATSLELPVLKAVETRQEVFERLFRFFIDRVIEKAVDSGEISTELDPTEVAGKEPVVVPEDRDPSAMMRQGYEDQPADEVSTERELGYEFSMPSPLRRMMSDLINSVTTIAQTFDPNNTNPALSRILLQIALGEGLEVQDAPDLVDEAIPEGYVDPIVKAQLAQAAQPAPEAGLGGGGNGYQQFPPGSDSNPYSAPMNSVPSENQRAGPYDTREAEVTGVTRARDGSRVVWTRRRELNEGIPELPEPQRVQVQGDRDEAKDEFQKDVVDVALKALDRERFAPESDGLS